MTRVYAIILLLLPFLAFAQRGEQAAQSTIPEYITKYSEIAKAEMRRSGIPASITLAQGILESNYGNSDLARKANNHFGIKCGNNWKGPTYIQDDDTEKECFRKYESVLHSYADHSNFLRGKDRYATLFELSAKDYKGWANGLKKAGYATNPNYASLLIRLIEERDLHRFDTEEKITPITPAEEEYYKTVSDKFYVFNGVKTVIAQPNELLMDMATKYDVSLSSLLKYNDMHEGEYIQPGTKIFLEPKKSTGFEAFHRVDEGETMHSISQKEGIKLKALLKKNGMTFGQEAAVGEILCLKKKCNETPKLKTDEEIKQDIKEKIQERVDKAVKDKQKQEAPVAVQEIEQPAEEISMVGGTPDEEIKPEEKPVVVAEPVEVEEVIEVEEEKIVEEKVEAPKAEVVKEVPPIVEKEAKELPVTPAKPNEVKAKYHTVGPQETLFKIASAYKLTVDELKQLNGITSNNISIGQRLVVSAPTGTAVTENPASAKPVEEKPMDERKPAPPAEKPAIASKPAPTITPATSNKPKVDVASIEEREPRYHVVGPQETMFKIAQQYKISVAELKVMNNIEGNSLTVGQKLLVGYTGVVRTDPVEKPSQAAAHEEPKLPKVEEQQPAQQQTTTSSEGPTYHKVLQGETLYSIATKYKLNVEQLKTLNNLPSNDIQPGRVLKLK